MSPLLLIANQQAYILNRRWINHGEAYESACRKAGVEPHDKARPESKEDSGLRQTTLGQGTNFIAPFTPGGLLEHIAALIISEDHVRNFSFLFN
jgi:hypothetical protein